MPECVSLTMIVRACTKCTCVLHHKVTEKQREVNEEKRRQSESDVNARKRKEMKTFTLDCFPNIYVFFTFMFANKTSYKTVWFCASPYGGGLSRAQSSLFFSGSKLKDLVWGLRSYHRYYVLYILPLLL